jgi:hypothetical protein
MASEGQQQEVNETLSQLVSHFNQSIHAVEEVPPYFVANKLPPLDSPVLQFCLDRLKPLPGHAIAEWIIGYQTIHDIIISDKEESVPIPVLQNYEVIFWIWGEKLKKDHLVISGPSHGRLVEIAALISNDIRRAHRKSDKYSDYLRCRVLIPTLLRLMNHVVHTLQICQDFDRELSLSPWVDCCVTLLPFIYRRINPTIILPCLSAKQSLNDWCISPPDIVPANNELSLEQADWEVLTLNGVGMCCCSDGADSSVHLVDDIWKSLASLLQLPLSAVSSRPCSAVLRFLDIVRVAQAVQARFYGHDSEDIMELRTESKVVLGSRIVRPIKPLRDKAYQADPSAVHALLTLVTLLDVKDRDSTSELVSYLVPCCLELVDSTDLVESTLGINALASLIVVLDSTNVAWHTMDNAIISKMENAIRCHRQGEGVLAIGRSQHIILQRLAVSGKVHAACSRQWLAKLNHADSRPPSEHCWATIVGGVIPSLYILAKMPNAQGMEVGRLGLSILLPMVAGDFVEPRNQVAAIVALINLMVSAHPIMPHHGGKIMCHLLAAFSNRRTNKPEVNQALRCWTRHATVVCLLLCGSSARKIIQAIELEKEKYQRCFIEMISEVQSMTVTLSG